MLGVSNYRQRYERLFISDTFYRKYIVIFNCGVHYCFSSGFGQKENGKEKGSWFNQKQGLAKRQF